MKKITALLLCLVGFGPAYGAKFQTLEEALTKTAAKIAQNTFIPKNSNKKQLERAQAQAEAMNGGGYREVDLIAVNSWALVNVYIETYKDYELHDGILEWYVRETD